MFPHDRIVEQLYAVLRVETAAKKIEVMIFSSPHNWDGWRNIKKHWAFQQQNWSRPPLKIFVEVTSPSKITCWLDVLLCLLVSPKALGYLYQSIREVKELFLTFWKHPPPLPLGGQQAWKRGNLFLGICWSPEKAFVSAQNAQNVEKPKSIEAQAGKGSCSAAPAAEDHRSRSTHRLRTSSVQLRPWPELHVSCNWMGVIMDCLLVFFWQKDHGQASLPLLGGSCPWVARKCPSASISRRGSSPQRAQRSTPWSPQGAQQWWWAPCDREPLRESTASKSPDWLWPQLPGILGLQCWAGVPQWTWR